MSDKLLDVFLEKTELYIAASAAAFMGLALMAIFTIRLVVRNRRKIALVFYEEPREFLRYTLNNLPAFTVTAAWNITKFTIKHLFLAALAVSYAFVGFWLIETWYRLHGVIRGDTLSYEKFEVVGLVAGSVLASHLTVTAIRGFVALIRAFRSRHSFAAKAKASIQIPAEHFESGFAARRKRSLPRMPRLAIFNWRLRPFVKAVIALAFGLLLFEVFVIGLHGAEIALALAVIAGLATFAFILERIAQKWKRFR